MAFNELMQSLQMFQSGMSELATGRAIRGAADQAQQINMNEKDEFEKRRQLTQIGTGLAAQLSSFGTNPAQIQSSVGAIMPQQLQGPQDFFQQAAMAKTPAAQQQYTQAGNQIQNGLAAAPLNTMQKEQVRQGDYSNKTSRLALLLSASGAGQNGKDAKPLPAEQIDKITTVENGLMNMDELLNRVTKDPSLVGLNKKLTDANWLQNPASRNDPQFASFKALVTENFDQYRKEITGAGASEGELAKLEASRPSATDSPSQFIAKVQNALQVGEDKRARALTNFGRAGYNMSNFNADPISKFGTQLKQQKVQLQKDDASLELLLKASQQNPNLLTPDQRQKIEMLKEVKSRGKL
jgi:hypothetical protein